MYLVISAGYHGCHTWRRPPGWAWRRVCHIYADYHGAFVKLWLVSKNVIDSIQLEVDFQSNVGEVLACLLDIFVEFLSITQDTNRGDATDGVAELLDLLVGTRVVVGQDDYKEANFLCLAELEHLLERFFIPRIPCVKEVRPQMGWVIDLFCTKSPSENVKESSKSLTILLCLIVDIRTFSVAGNSKYAPVFQTPCPEYLCPMFQIPASISVVNLDRRGPRLVDHCRWF